MDSDSEGLASTTSLCPTCLEQIPGRYEARDGSVHLTRTCPDHGTTSREVWGSVDHWEWASDFGPTNDGDSGAASGAPSGASASDGNLTVESDHACLAVIEVTEDCNLSCSFCFASSGPGGTQRSFDAVVDLLATSSKDGPRPIQFSGGEPTVRDDLPELVEQAVEMGFTHIEVNTNGLRLAEEDGYAQRLADAGVTALYLQFDGLERETHIEIREADILDHKHAAIEACREADLPVILVPTVVPGTNDHEMGSIVEFALDNDDIVRSVNFQPVSHFGRYEQHEGRFTLDEAARQLAEQVDGIDTRDLLPAPCCSSYCQIGTAVVPGEDEITPVTQYVTDDMWDSISGLVDEADYMELLAGTEAAKERACDAAGCCGTDVTGGAAELFDDVLPVSFTGFMDADAGDVDRLSNCCLSVPTPDGELVPFCGYNMTTDDGAYALRNRHGWGGRDSVDESLPEPPETVPDEPVGPAPDTDYPTVEED